MANDVDIWKRTFVFSREQQDRKKSIDIKMGKNPEFGTVLVNGTPKVYTDIVTDMTKVKFADSIALITGDIRRIKFTKGN